MTPQRPALAEVLATLTGKPPLLVVLGRACGVAIEASRVGYRPQSDRATTHGSAPTLWHRWTHDSPAEAVEALATARLWPWEPGEGPRWRCEACCGCGGMDGIGGYVDCDACASTGDSTAPPTLAALVAVASLGAPQLARYVHVAGEIARAAGCTGAVVVWRVMPREALRKHCDAAHPRGDEGFNPVTFFAHQVRWEMRGLKVDFEKGEGFGRAIIEATWPMLRDLHAGDVHLVELDASRIVLAVEAVS